ncbi:MAG: M1 family aminopeptidase [Bryobacteraceae bacterium]
MRVPVVLLLVAAITRCALGASAAARVGDQVEHISLDAEECYRVLDLDFAKEDLKIYLSSGYLIFSRPIGSARLGAIFVTSAEAGDADLLLMPPTRSERSSLAKFTNSPTLEEHFKVAAFIFTDGTGDQLLAQLKSNPAVKKSPDMGGLIADRWNSVLANLVASFETRVVFDILSDHQDSGLFYMAVSGDKLHNFDVLYDPAAQDQILVGKLADRDHRLYFDTWTNFQARSFRNGAQPRVAGVVLDNLRIEAAIAPDLSMQAVTRGTLRFQDDDHRPRSVVPFSLTPDMKITAASIDGHPVEVFDRESMRSDLISNREDRQFLLVSESGLDPSTPHEIEIQHAGAVIHNAGNDIYYVGSRGTWYPRTGGDQASYDLTFRYPKALSVAATGKLLEDRTDGDWRVTRFKTDTPVRFAGFNLGDFQSVALERNGYSINLYANRRLERALAPKPTPLAMTDPLSPSYQRQRNPADGFAPATEAPDPAPRMENLTRDVVDTIDFMTEEFGPTPIRNLAITPIPGGFGQGFPGLVYLSTLAYLDPGQRPPQLRDRGQETFFSYLLEAHEVAHQWWGNMVVPASYHDDWLIESLANYSALLLLERKKGSKALDAVLDEYRNHLLSKTSTGASLESAGPIVWGYRLESSLAPDAWRTVTYEKGTWIIHMLRRRLGDEKFLSLLRDICSHHPSIGTDQFRQLASQYAPASHDPDLKVFFDNWVYGTGIPAVKLSYSWNAVKLSGTLSGTLAQRDVDGSFAAFVPVEVQSGGKNNIYWLATGSDPAPFSLPLRSPPTKVTLAAADCLMTISK